MLKLIRDQLMTDITIGYWGIRGLGQIPRLLASYTGVKFTEKQYKAPEAWFGADKDSLGLPFPNLPYLIQGDFKLTESSAINHYLVAIGNKPELLGKTIEDQAVVTEILGVLGDILTPTVQLCFNEKFNDEKEKVFNEKIKTKATNIYNFVKGKEWALGYLTLVDFKLAEAVEYLQGIWPEHVKEFPDLVSLRERFNELPEIKAYYARPDAIKGPFLPPTAKWH